MSEKIEVILVDVGSTAIKCAEVIDGKFANRKVYDSIEQIQGTYKKTPAIVSTVRNNYEELKGLFQGEQDIVLNHLTHLPIRLDYKTPETLGADRIALAVGAHQLFPEENNLIIDLGTCATIDFIDSSGVFHGGIISPGLTMRMKAMSKYTKSLPDISEDWEGHEAKTLGKSTNESLLSGSLNGMTNEINATIETIKDDFASINIILTGGDAKIFESRIKAHIFAGSKIVEIGLYRIWQHQ